MLHIVLADTRSLRILGLTAEGALIEVTAIADAEAAAHERDLGTDRPGRVVNAAAGSRVSLSARHTARAVALQRWLKTIGRQLHDLVSVGQCDGIVLVASSRLLGLLRIALPGEVRRMTLVEVPRDLVKQKARVLEERLRPALMQARERLHFPQLPR